ncbi:MAG: alpha-L-rhamnosidase N-terminal domain-containing protein [Candidatus Methylacidiphilales bacterium]|nr:alpha-L-rhamnosidase N-terminal domain-containing protein [Candidatus Methylacidiphilales bacterium]
MNNHIPKSLADSWIWCSHPKPERGDLHAAFRKTWDLPFEPAKATLHLFAFTRYRLYLNGIYVLRGPARYENKEPCYDVIDVSGSLRSGTNTLAILVHRDSPNGRIQGHEPGLTAWLDVEGTCGEQLSICTDETWKAVPEESFLSPSLLWTAVPGEDDIHISHGWGSIPEVIDARLGLGDWTAAVFQDADWPEAVFCPGQPEGNFKERAIPLLQEKRLPSTGMKVAEMPLDSAWPLTLRAGEEVLIDIGRLVQAYGVFDFEASVGSRLLLGYLPPEQEKGLPVADRTSLYIAEEGRQTWMGGDTFAFRRLLVRLETGTVTLHDLRLVEVLYPFQLSGRFRCSDSDLTHLWHIAARSLELLSEDAYVDCADRERVEWMDSDPPAFDCTRVMMDGPGEGGGVVFADSRLFREMLRRTALSQREDGCVKAHTCSDRWDIHAVMEDRCALWMHGVKKYYDHTGDLGFVGELWPALMRQARWFLEQRTERGLIASREWMCWDNPMAYQICEGTALNAFVAGALRAMVGLGALLGEEADGFLLKKESEALVEAINCHLWDDEVGAYHAGFFADEHKIQSEVFFGQIKFRLRVERGLVEPSLHANLFALNQGVAGGDRLAKSQNWVLGHLDQATGVLIHHYLFDFLYGLNDAKIDQIVLERIRDKWRRMIRSPLESTWEDFVHGSKIHAYGLVPAYFLSAYVLGVRPLETPDKKQLLIEPRLGDLEWAGGVVTTPWGHVEVEWNSKACTFHLSIPQGISVELRLPCDGIKKMEIRDKQGRAIPVERNEAQVGAFFPGGVYLGHWGS